MAPQSKPKEVSLDDGGLCGMLPFGGCSWSTWQFSRFFVVSFGAFAVLSLSYTTYAVAHPVMLKDATIKRRLQQSDIDILNTIWLSVYAAGAYFWGRQADVRRSSRRVLLAAVMIGSGIGIFAMGMAHGHSWVRWWFLIPPYVLAAAFQSGGFPLAIAMVGSWFGRKHRGLIFGLWACNAWVGHMVGEKLTTAMLSREHYTYGNFTISRIPSYDFLNRTSFDQMYDENLTVPSLVVANETCKDLLFWNGSSVKNTTVNASKCDGAADFYCDHLHDKCHAFWREMSTAIPNKTGVVKGKHYPGGWITEHHLNQSTKYHFMSLPPECDSTECRSLNYYDKPMQNMTDPLIPGGKVNPQQLLPNTTMYQVYYKDRPWGDSFYVGGFVSVFGGVMVLLFLIEHPHNVWIRNPDEETKSAPSNAQALEAKLVEPDQEDIGPVRLLWALSLPGVLDYSLSYFFAKFAAFTFPFWLPYHLGITPDDAAHLSSFLAYGAMLGGVMFGLISDVTKCRGVVVASALYCSVVVLIVYPMSVHDVATKDADVHKAFIFVLGVFLNGAQVVIATAITADLGEVADVHSKEARGTIAGIVEGTGSIGACFTTLLLQQFHQRLGWRELFYAMAGCSGFAGLLLTRMVLRDLGVISSDVRRSRVGLAGGLQRRSS